MALTVLIAASRYLAALQQQVELSDAETFEDTDALKALDAITRQPPQVIAIEQRFASSARGAAFINRIKASLTLAGCEIRIVEVATPPGSTDPAPTAAAETAPPAEAPPRAPTATRRAERLVVSGNVEVLVDGNPATLINISLVGAQVVSASTLRPNQRVRMSLVDATRPVRFNGVVAWATFEMPKEGPRYRAGVDFYDASPEMVARFMDSIPTE